MGQDNHSRVKMQQFCDSVQKLIYWCVFYPYNGKQMLQTAIDAATEAGTFLRNSAGTALTIERKSSSIDPVTQIDRAAEKIIVDIIRGRYPDHSILGEEGGGSEGTSPYRWIIDPLDGTVNFTHGLPIFCVSIGLEHDGMLIAGAVYEPNTDELYTAERGGGAYLNGSPIRISKADRLIESLLITGFPYNIHDNPHSTIERFEDFLTAAQGIRRLGSAALDLCYIAAGRGDGYWEMFIHPWDIAAGILLVEEAGGRVTDFTGASIDAFSEQVLATNGNIHDEMIAVLRKRL
jgi:myo-inositol-1(or 4)-monophosphatase